ncbi:hypothetical protein [Thiolinea disciformis]|uniref:hypothetical protein n=1 Tax=Thiolinea disciformis TaxID=125614 RepID=UPI00036A7AE4|nr:hypothetical protein [Thiolinea disciformis]
MTYIVRNNFTSISHLAAKRETNCLPFGRELGGFRDYCNDRCHVDPRLSNREMIGRLSNLLDELCQLEGLAKCSGYNLDRKYDALPSARYDGFLKGLAALPGGKKGAYDAGFTDGFDTGFERGLAAGESGDTQRLRGTRGKRVAFDKGFREGYNVGVEDGSCRGCGVHHKQVGHKYRRHLGHNFAAAKLDNGFQHRGFAHAGLGRDFALAQSKDFGFFSWFSNSIGDVSNDGLVNVADVKAWLANNESVVSKF